MGWLPQEPQHNDDDWQLADPDGDVSMDRLRAGGVPPLSKLSGQEACPPDSRRAGSPDCCPKRASSSQN